MSRPSSRRALLAWALLVLISAALTWASARDPLPGALSVSEVPHAPLRPVPSDLGSGSRSR